MDTLINLLNECGNPDKPTREHAEQSIRDALAASPFDSLVMLVQLGVNSDPSVCDERIAQQSLLRAKLYFNDDLVEGDWRGSEALESIKTLLLESLPSVSRVRRRVMGEMIRIVHSSFQWEGFTERCFDMISAVQGDEDALAAALGALYTYTKRFKTFGLEPQRKQHDISRALLDSLPDLLGSASYEVMKLIFKIFECICESFGDAAVKIDNAKFQPWFDFMFAFPTDRFDRVPREQYVDYVKCVKRIGLISFGLLQDFTNKKKPSALATFFSASYTTQFYEMWVNWLTVCHNAGLEGGQPELHKKSAMSAMRFIKMCAFMPDAYEAVVKSTALSVITTQLFPYLCLREDDEAAFASDLDDFSRYMLDETMGEYNERQCASNTIVALCSFNKKYHDSNVIYQVLSFINAGLDEEESPRTFGFIHLLGVLRPKLRKMDDIWNQHLEPVIVDKIVPKTRSVNAPIRYKGTWLCGHYARVPMQNNEHFSAFVQLVLDMAQDSDPNVRLGAMNALCNYISMKRFQPYLRTVLVPLVEEVLSIMDKVNAAFLPMLLNYLAESFGPELSTLVVRLIHNLVQQFLAGHHDLRMQDGGGEDEPTDEAGISKFEATAIATMATLRTINNLVLSAEHNKEAVPQFLPDIMRLFNHIIQEVDNEDFLDVGIEILQHALFISDGVISEEAWQLVPKIHAAVVGGAVDYFAKFEPVLDNYVSSGRDFFVSNDDVVNVFYEICEKMILGDTTASDDDKKAAPQLIESIFHNCKGLADGKFDAHAPMFVRMLLQGLVRDDMSATPVRIWMCCAMCDAFWYNADLTTRVIFESGAYPFFFDGFFGFFRELIFPQAKAGLKGKASKKKAKEAEAGKCPISILNRKVIALGLVSFLNSICANSTEVDPAYVAEAVDLINYCITMNAHQYTSRLKYIKYWREHGEGKADSDGEEYDEDVDVTGASGDGDDIANAASGHMGGYGDDGYDDAVDDDDEEDEDADRFGDGGDEGDDYTSPIDAVNEASLYLEWINNAASGGLPHYVANEGKFDAAGLQDAQAVTAMYMEEIERSKEEERQEHHQRTHAWQQGGAHHHHHHH